MTARKRDILATCIDAAFVAAALAILLAGCGPGPVAQIGATSQPAVQIGSALAPAVQIAPGAVSVRLAAAPGAVAVQVADPNGPMFVVKPGAVVLTVSPGAMAVQTTVPMPDLTVPAIALGGLILAAVTVQVLAAHLLSKRRMTYGKRMGMAKAE